MRNLLIRLREEEEAATAVEYAIIAAFMGTALTGALFVLKDGLDTFYYQLAGILSGVL